MVKRCLGSALRARNYWSQYREIILRALTHGLMIVMCAQVFFGAAYLAFVGPSAAFTPDFRPMTPADFPDGQAQTIFAAEARRHIPWTKPDDVAIEPGNLGDLLGSSHPGGFHAAFVDGYVRFLKSTVEPGVLRALSTRNGWEKVGADEY